MTSDAALCDPPTTTNARSARIVTRLIGLVALAAALATVVGVTRGGIGYSPDSYRYMLVAQSVAAGEGVRDLDADGRPKLFTHLGPLLSVVIGAISRAGVTAAVAARGLNVACLAVSFLMTAWLAWRVGGRSRLAAVAGPVVLLLCAPVLQLHVLLLSEPLFLALLLVALASYGRAVDRASLRWLAAAGLAAGLAALARYAGLAVIGALTLTAFAHWPGPAARRLRAAIAFALPATLLPATWLVYGALATQRLGNRQLAWHPPTAEQWRQLARTFAQWVLPIESPGWLTWVGLAMFVTVVGLLLVREWGSSRGDEDGEAPAARKLRQALWAMAGAYLALILLTVCLFDAYTPLDNRILLPLRAILVVLVAGAVFRPPPWASAEMNGKRGPPVMSGDFRRAGRLPYGNLPLRPAVLLGPLLIALAVAQVVTLARWTAEARDKHLGFNSTVWQRSPTLLALAALPRRSIIYTNAFEAAYLLHGRPCKEVPALRDPNTGRPLTAAYAERLGRIRDDLRANDGYVVYARRLRRPMLASEEQLVRDLPLERVSETRDGAVYRLRSGS